MDNITPTPTQKRAKKYFSTYLTAILLFLSFGLGIFMGEAVLFKKEITNAQTQTIYLDLNHASINFSQFWQVWDLVKAKYIKKDSLQDKDMYYGAIQGLVASLQDPYSVFLPPKEADQFTKDLSGQLEGIGAEIAVRNDQLVVIQPMPSSPAEKAGLTVGDKILSINGESTKGMDVATAVSKIRGPANTVVALSINHNGKLRDLAIIRAQINVPSVLYALKSNNVAYLRVMQFNENTTNDLKKYIDKLQSKKVKGIILDLRDNPGGYLATAVEMASEWIEQGTIVSEKFSDGTSNVHEANGEHRLASFKTIVLVNHGSASASEIVAGALQDMSKATILGEQTYGKGSVQDYQTFSDGSALKLTVAEWYTPKGKNINKAGITPDIIFKQDVSKERPGQDTMLQKALNLFAANKVK